MYSNGIKIQYCSSSRVNQCIHLTFGMVLEAEVRKVECEMIWQNYVGEESGRRSHMLPGKYSVGHPMSGRHDFCPTPTVGHFLAMTL